MKCNNIIPKEKKDPYLEQKLYEERDGIIYKCIIALRGAIERNYQFGITQDCIDNLMEYKKENSLPVEFWTTYLRPLKADENPTLESQRLYDNFRRWCAMQGIERVPSAPEFRKEVSNYCKKSWSKITKRTAKGMQLTTHRMNEAWEHEYEFHPQGGYWQYTEDDHNG